MGQKLSSKKEHKNQQSADAHQKPARPEQNKQSARAGMPLFLQRSTSSADAKQDEPITVQRDGGTTLPTLPRLTPPSMLQPREPGIGPLFDYQFRIDPQLQSWILEQANQYIDQNLNPAKIKAGLAQINPGAAQIKPVGTPAMGASDSVSPGTTAPAGTPAPQAAPQAAPPAAAPAPAGPLAPTVPGAPLSPQPPAAAPPAATVPTPSIVLPGSQEVSFGIIWGLLTSAPQVDHALSRIESHARTQAGRLSTGEKIAAITTTAMIGIGSLAVLTSDPRYRKEIFDEAFNAVNGKVLPIPFTPVSVEFNKGADNLLIGFHLDLGSVLPSALGFTSASPLGPNPLRAPLKPLLPLERAVEDGAAALANATGEEISERIIEASAGGSDLSPRTRNQLEKGLGADLSGVRVHTDAEADQLARSVDAKAFTTGRNIFLRAGAYKPDSPEGLKLLAHEAVHTLQQASGPVAGTPAPGGVSVSDPSDSFEKEAETVSKEVAGSSLPRHDAQQSAESHAQSQSQPQPPAPASSLSDPSDVSGKSLGFSPDSSTGLTAGSRLQSRSRSASTAARSSSVQRVVVQRQPAEPQKAQEPTGEASTPASSASQNIELHERHEKAYKALLARIGTLGVVVRYSKPEVEKRGKEVETESLFIGPIARRQEYPYVGFDSLGPAIAYASVVGAGVGAVVLEYDKIYFPAQLSMGEHSFIRERTYGIQRGAGVLAVTSQDGYVYRSDQTYQPAVGDATPPDLESLRELAGVRPEGAKETDEIKMPHATSLEAGQDEAFIKSYLVARALAALNQNEATGTQLINYFKPTEEGKGTEPGKGVSPKAQQIIDHTRQLGSIFRDVLELESDIERYSSYIDRQWTRSFGSEKVELNGETKTIWEWNAHFKNVRQDIETNKKNILSQAPMLAHLVDWTRSAPLEYNWAEKAGYWIGVGVVDIKTAVTGEMMPQYGVNQYDASLLGREAPAGADKQSKAKFQKETDEAIRAEYLSKLDGVMKAVGNTKQKVIEGDLDFLLGLSSLRQQVAGDFGRIKQKNPHLKDSFENMLSSYATKEMAITIATTAGQLVLQVAGLFFPPLEFVSATLGFITQARDMSRHFDQWEASQAAVDPATAMADQQEAVKDLALDTFWMALQAKDLAQSLPAAFEGIEKGGRKLPEKLEVDEVAEERKKLPTDEAVMPPRPQSGPVTETRLSVGFREKLVAKGVPGGDPNALRPNDFMQKCNGSWKEVKSTLLVEGEAVSDFDRAASRAMMMRMHTTRYDDAVGLLQQAMFEIEMEKGGKHTFESVGKRSLTSDLDFNIRGPYSEDVVIRFNEKFRAEHGGIESAVYYDTNAYTNPAFLDYSLHPQTGEFGHLAPIDPNAPAIDADFLKDPAFKGQRKVSTTWEKFQEERLSHYEDFGVSGAKERAKDVAKEAEKLYGNDLRARLMYVTNYEQEVTAQMATAEQLLGKGPEGSKAWAEHQKKLLAGAQSPAHERYLRRVLQEAEARTVAYQDRVIAKLNEIAPPGSEAFTPERLARMAHSDNPSELNLYMKARNELYAEQLSGLADLKSRYAQATSEAEKLQLAAQIQAKHSQAVYFASESFGTQGSYLVVVQNMQKALKAPEHPAFAVLLASQAKAAFYEQYGKALGHGAGSLDEVLKANKATERIIEAFYAHPLAGKRAGEIEAILARVSQLNSLKGAAPEEVYAFLMKQYSASTVAEALQAHHAALAAARDSLLGKMLEISNNPIGEIEAFWQQQAKIISPKDLQKLSLSLAQSLTKVASYSD